MATATKMVMMGTARMKWLERKRQKMKRESDGVSHDDATINH